MSSGILPTFITGDEARRLAREVFDYFGAVGAEVAASSLDPAARLQWTNTSAAFNAWYQDLINASAVSQWLGAKAIADDAETWRDAARTFSERARAAGAPATAPPAPEIPGVAASATDIVSAAKWVALAVVAVAAVSAVRTLRA